MKKSLTILVAILLIYSCGNLDNSSKQKELNLKEAELKIKEQELMSKEKEELKEKQKELEKKDEDLNQKEKVITRKINQKYIAVIQDTDGYTNIRNGMSSNAKIIDRLFEGEHYEVFPSSDSNWWIVNTKDNVKGYVHKSRIRIIN